MRSASKSAAWPAAGSAIATAFDDTGVPALLEAIVRVNAPQSANEAYSIFN
jgi:hypothetical protein